MVDTRKPNVMRVAPIPLYNSFDDVRSTVCVSTHRVICVALVSAALTCCLSAGTLQVHAFVVMLREALSEVAPGAGL